MGRYTALVAGRVLAWSLLVALLIAGMAGLTGAVEAADLGTGGAWRGALSAATVALVLLAPTLAAAGAAVAAARMVALGEALASELAGIAPHRGAAVALAVGGLLGVGQHLAADHLLWRAERLQPALLAPLEAPWVWLADAHQAVRVADGLVADLDDAGRLVGVQPGAGVAPALLAQARMLQRPQTASGAALAAAGPARAGAVLERQSRRARALACALLAACAWLLGQRSRLGGGGASRIGGALALALGWQGLDALLVAAAAQGQLGPTVGAWMATGAALSGTLLLAAWRWSR